MTSDKINKNDKPDKNDKNDNNDKNNKDNKPIKPIKHHPKYLLVVPHIQEFINTFDIRSECSICGAKLKLNTITINFDDNGYTIAVKGYCNQCECPRNYYKVIN